MEKKMRKINLISSIVLSVALLSSSQAEAKFSFFHTLKKIVHTGVHVVSKVASNKDVQGVVSGVVKTGIKTL